MSNVTTLSPNKEKKRPSVSSKCLLNIRSIVTQNVSSNRNNKNSSIQSSTSTLPPLPLTDSIIPLKESIDDVIRSAKENKGKKQTKSPTLPNRNVLTECLQIPPTKSITSNDEQDQSKLQTFVCEKQEEDIISKQLSINSKELDYEPSTPEISLSLRNSDSTIIPPLPLDCSMYPFTSSSSSHKKPALSFPAHSSNRINEEYLTQMRRIIESSSPSSSSSTATTTTNSNEIKPIELSIHRRQSIPIHRFDSTSPTISTIEGSVNLQGPLIFINSALNISTKSDTSSLISNQHMSNRTSMNEQSKKNHQNYFQSPSPICPTSYARLPYPLRQKQTLFNSSPTEPIRLPKSNLPAARRSLPQFESVRTPAQKTSTIIPSELFDCCQTEAVCLKTEVIRTRRSFNQRNSTTMEWKINESEARANYFRDVAKIREIMLNVSKRLTTDNNLMSPLRIVDTHCHFDLIFDRLHIKHHDLKKYFEDYNEYYPAGLSFELAIQVFWRPQHLTENNWNNRYSKYLDDDRVYGSCGIHPHWSSAWKETSAEDIERCLQHPKIVAIGEIGLDFGPKNTCKRHEQFRAFEAQLKLAAKWLKPIVIHSRDAYQETFDLMKKYLESDHKIHLHCFVGTMDDVELFTSYFKEMKFGFTPIITRTTFLHTVIQQLDLTQILSETDSPYFMPDELSAYTRCSHPGMVYSVVETVAQLRYLPVNNVADQLRENARQIYGV
ncbi:hypothetical protein I4U23_008044 [Adineta vaga]|nr:hypothetical protein I4U23_008044 [Adineta vaga]